MTATSAGPRIAPGTRRDVGWLGWVVSAVSGRVSGTGPPNLFLTLGRHRALFRGVAALRRPADAGRSSCPAARPSS